MTFQGIAVFSRRDTRPRPISALRDHRVSHLGRGGRCRFTTRSQGSSERSGKQRPVEDPVLRQPNNGKPGPLRHRSINTTPGGRRGAAAPSASQAASSPASLGLNRPDRLGRDQTGAHARRSALQGTEARSAPGNGRASPDDQSLAPRVPRPRSVPNGTRGACRSTLRKRPQKKRNGAAGRGRSARTRSGVNCPKSHHGDLRLSMIECSLCGVRLFEGATWRRATRNEA